MVFEVEKRPNSYVERVGSMMISKLNILINPYTKNNKLLRIVEARVESSGIGF